MGLGFLVGNEGTESPYIPYVKVSPAWLLRTMELRVQCLGFRV